MQEVTLQSVFINTKKQDGTPYIDKNGNSFKMVVITSESGSKSSMFLSETDEAICLPTISKWKAGDTVQVEIEQSGDFTNFKPVLNSEPQTLCPNGNTPNLTTDGAMDLHNLGVKVKSLEIRLSRIEGQLGIKGTETASEGQNEPNTVQPVPMPDVKLNEIKVEDIPF